MRLAVYGTVSTTLACWVVFSAFTQRVNYYAACVHLAKSNLCMMILLNMGFFVAILTGKLMQAIFFGQLRAIEVEHLYERSWYAVSETCLAMTIFRDEFNLHFVVLFTMLLFLKIFHWLCHDRVEFMEQAPNDRLLFHLRMAHLMTVLFVIDYYLASSGIYSIWEKKPSMMIMFGFEYTIMFCNLISIIAKYILNTIDWQSEEPWEGKSMYVFFIDLITDFMKLVAYVGFFVIICIYYQLPLHIVRDVYVTFRSFVQKCRDLYRYRRATRNMDQLYPNATAQDLAQSSDSTCIICREDMHAHAPDADANGDDAAAAPPPHHGQHQQNYDQPKKLPCGHIFHFHCLRSWLERQQTCPTW
ncbi:hypothetical protein BC940DRAFT_242139 [Gongronella butleri]|nr:hypothetical protein BC940DRAFT_242139 [Gongronella butleri]